MSEYSYDDRPRRSHRTREREPQYVNETTYIERGGKGASRDLVYRPRHEDSVEDIQRDFPPPGSDYREPRYMERPRHAHRPRRDYDDDYYDRRSSHYDDRDGYYSDEYERRPRHGRRKSVVDNIKELGEAAGLGGIIGAVTGNRSRSRSRSRSRHRGRGRDDYSDRYDRGYDSDRYDRRSRRYSSSRSPSGRKKTGQKWEQAAKAAIVAGAVEAFRTRKTPGPWTGEKGQRVATAALGAAGIDGLIDKDPDKHSKLNVAGSAVGGLLANRLANGSRSRSRGRQGSRSPSRSRSRSRSLFSRSRSRSRSLFSRSRSRGRSGSRDREGGDHTIRNVAGAGAVLAAGKALYDRVRSKSRSRRDRSRSRSVSSEDSYVPSRSRRNRGYSGGRSMDGTSEDLGRANSDRRVAMAAGAAGPVMNSRGGGKATDLDSSDSESTTDMEKQRKKLRGKELLTAGLATVATIHAAHGVYSSMEASEKRRRLVSGGEMSPEEARKRKSKNMLQDAAAVGIAALGIKSAFSEWKDMNEQRRNMQELEARRRKRRKQRERREREARQNALNGLGMPGYADPNAYPVAAHAYPTYADANPYGASTVPPPPIGAAPGARY